MAALVHSTAFPYVYTLPPNTTSPVASASSTASFPYHNKYQSSYRSASSSDPSRRRYVLAQQRARRPSVMGTTASSTDFSIDDDEDELEYEHVAIESSRRRSIDSERSFSSFSASRPVNYRPTTTTVSSTSVNAWFNNTSSNSALPCYSPPDPSSPFTQDLYEEMDDPEDELYESGRRRRIMRSTAAIFQRRATPEATRVELPSSRSEDDDDEESSQSHVPTCTDSVRKHWDSMTIRVNLVLFRVKKRLANKLSFKIV